MIALVVAVVVIIVRLFGTVSRANPQRANPQLTRNASSTHSVCSFFCLFTLILFISFPALSRRCPSMAEVTTTRTQCRSHTHRAPMRGVCRAIIGQSKATGNTGTLQALVLLGRTLVQEFRKRTLRMTMRHTASQRDQHIPSRNSHSLFSVLNTLFLIKYSWTDTRPLDKL